MPTHLEFKQESDVPDRSEWITFSISGSRLGDGEEWTEEFTCLPEVPGGALDDLARSVGQDERGHIRFNQVSVLRFIRAVLVPEDEDRFDEMVYDKDRIVSLETLGNLMMKLAEALTGRPTGPQSTSTVGSRANGDTSAPG